MTTASVTARIPDLPTAICYLFCAYQKPLDDIALLVYEHQLADIAFPLVQAAVLEAPRRLTFLPAVHELRDLCGTIRREWSNATPFVPCDGCREGQPGWQAITDATGALRLTRCECFLAHQRAVGPPMRPLPAPESGESERGFASVGSPTAMLLKLDSPTRVEVLKTMAAEPGRRPRGIRPVNCGAPIQAPEPEVQ